MDRAGAYVKRVNDGVKNVVENKGAVIVFVVLTLLLIVVIIAYIVWRLNSSDLKSVKVLRNPRKLHNNKAFMYSASKLPAMTIGQQFSMSFWLYLTDFQTTSSPKVLLMRQAPSSGTTTTNSLVGANPVVFLDSALNQMYVCIATTRSPQTTPTTLNQLLNTEGKGATNNWTYLYATVQYVPLQRWVNYTFTVQDNILTVFQDGSIYTVQSLFDMADPTNASAPRPVFAACTGDISVGNVSKTMSGDATGFINNVEFFNYALNSNQVQTVYGNGPTSTNMLRSFGIPDYGVRTPIYVVDGEDETKSDD